MAYQEFEVLCSPVRPFLIAMFWDKRSGNLICVVWWQNAMAATPYYKIQDPPLSALTCSNSNILEKTFTCL